VCLKGQDLRLEILLSLTQCGEFMKKFSKNAAVPEKRKKGLL
jgi:hypothetical protein